MTPASPRPRVLLVDGDVQARLVFEVTLKASGFEVLVAAQGEEALSLLTREMVDVVVADTELAELDGYQLCSSLRGRPEAARLLIVLLSADRTQRSRSRLAGSGADDFLLKPAYAHELDQRLRALLRRRQRERLIAGQDDGQPLGGSLTEVAVVDLLSLVEVSGRSGVLTVRGPSGNRGELYFRQGRIVDAEVGHLSGPEGVYRLLGWSTGTFVLEWKNIRRRDAVAMSNADILVEGLRRLDEWNRLLQGIPGTQTIYEVDYRRLADHLAEIPDEVNALLRLFDGVRSLALVIEDSGFPDLDALRVIRRLVESQILVEAHPSESGSALGATNPVFEGWQPEVSSPLAERPVVSEGEPAAAEEDDLAALPAPDKGPSPTATSPGLGPREPVAAAAKAGRSTALGIPTIEKPSAPTTLRVVPPPPDEPPPEEAAPTGLEPPLSLSAPLSLDLAEEPEMPLSLSGPLSGPAEVQAAAPASTAESRHAPAADDDSAVPRRQQTQIFSRKEAMEELGIGRKKGPWAAVFLAAVAAVVAAISFGALRSGGGVPAGIHKDTVIQPPQATGEKVVAETKTGDPSASPHGGPPPLPPVDLPAGQPSAAGSEVPPHVPPAPAKAGETGEGTHAESPSAAVPNAPPTPAHPGATGQQTAPGHSPAVAEGTHAPESHGSSPVEKKAPPPTAVVAREAGERDSRPAEGDVALAAGAPSDFKGDPVKALGDCKSAFAGGRFRQALAACGDATKGNPTSSAAFAMLAHAQLNRDKPNEALAAAEKAIALDPSQADAYVIVGGVEQDRGHTSAAKTAYLKYLQLAPRGRYASDLRAIVDTL